MRYSNREDDDDEIEITQYNFRKYGAFIPVSRELLDDMYAEYTPIVLTRRQKIRAWMSQKVADIRLRIGSKIAGVDLEDREP